MKRNPTPLLLLLLLLVAGCSGEQADIEATNVHLMTRVATLDSSPTPITGMEPTTTINSPEPVPSVTPIEILATSTTTATSEPVAPESEETVLDDNGPCGGSQWDLIPVGVYEYPQGEGWKLVIIRFAFHNGSSIWGQPWFGDGREATLTTEEGFTYSVNRQMNGIYTLPEVPFESPYGSRSLILIPNKLWFGSIMSDASLPPGFASLGATMALDQDGSNWFQHVFRVAESQEHFRLTLNKGSVYCYSGGSWETDDVGTIEINLDTDLGSVEFPTETPQDEFQDLVGATIDLEDVTLTFDNALRSAGQLELELTATNKSGGYEVDSELGPFYLIGDDGIVHFPSGDDARLDGKGFLHFRLGPAQAGTARIKYDIPDTVQKLKLIFGKGEEHSTVLDLSEY